MIKDLDILLVSTKGELLPDLIKLVQGNKYNHTGILLQIEGAWYVSESIKEGVALTDFEEHYKNNQKYELLILSPIFNITPEKINEIKHFIISETGHFNYDFKNLLFDQPIKFLSKMFTGKELWYGRNGKLANRTFICGEWVSFIFNTYFGLFDNHNKLAPVEIFNNVSFTHHAVE